MKMRKNKFIPMNSKLNSLKKTKVQFSTRLSGCLGEHQSQEFFERVNITRQSGICSKNKNNSFGDKRSNSFRQTLQLNVPFVADFSDSKQFCICYPVHFFRKKLHSYDSEDNRLASVRVYFPASRMKNGNDFKISLDLKKRSHLHPYQFEFVGYSSLLTLSLEDLSLAVFRAKSSSEKYKIATSLAIPKLLISPNNSNSQIGTPIFIGTERIYSRILKLIACSQSDAFKLNNTSAINSDSNLHLRKCLLKWIGLDDFLPSSARIIFVRRVSSDSGDTLGASILNSPGPKIRRSRIKETERMSIRLKQTKFELLKEFEDEIIYQEESRIHPEKMINFEFQENKRPRGRPKKSMDTSAMLSLNTEINNIDDISFSKKDETDVGKIKCESIQTKSESTSNSMTDSTSEEKYSVQLSSCTTPDTNKSCSPVIINGAVTTTVSSTASVLRPSNQIGCSSIVKNKRGRPRKYPVSVNADQKIYTSRNSKLNYHSSVLDSENGSLNNRKRSATDLFDETSKKRLKSSNSSISSNDGNLSKMLTHGLEFHKAVNISNDEPDFIYHSIWRPLKHPLPAPDPIVPFIKRLSNTGLGTNRKLKNSSNFGNHTEIHNRDLIPPINFSEFSTHKLHTDSMSSESLNKAFLSPTNIKSSSNIIYNNQMSVRDISPVKSIMKDVAYSPNNNSQYLMQNNGFNPLMNPPNMSSMSYNSALLSPLINNLFNSNSTSFGRCQSPIMNNLASLFPQLNTPNPLKMQPPPVSLSLFYENSCRQMYQNSHYPSTENCMSSTISHNSQQNLQYHHYNQILLASKYDSLYPNLSWNNDYQWKY